MNLNQTFAFACCFISSLLFTPLVFGAATTQTQIPIAPTSINVRDYGAKGDGEGDDTKAIQSAVNAANVRSKDWSRRVEHWSHLTKGAIDNPHAEIVFPQGTYKISSPIVFGRFNYLRGLGEAVIENSNPSYDSFYFHGVQQAVVENMQFRGGKTQLRFWTNNIGIATISVTGCAFYDSSDFAIECRSYTKRVIDLDITKPWAPYEVQWKDGTPTLTPNSAENLLPWFNSTVANIAHCRFENTMHAADISGDTEVIRDCEVVTNPQMEGPVFRLAGLVSLYRIKGRARLNSAKKQYWIEAEPDNFYSGVTVRDCDFDTDAAQGMCLVRSPLLPCGTSIIVDGSRVKSAGCPEGAIVWIAKSTQPNIISINDVKEISGRRVKAVNWEETPDAETLEKIKDQPKNAETKLIYKIQIAGNSSNVDSGTPEIFAPLRLAPIPEAALKETFVPEFAWNYNDLEARTCATSGVLLATDFGVDQNPATDDTQSIQKVFDAVARQSNGVVIFPAGQFTISKTIQLPPRVAIRVAGTAAFVMDGTEKDIFSIAKAEEVAFRNCTFNGGRNGVIIACSNRQKARIAFENCSFYDQAQNGIQALAGTGATSEDNQAELRVRGGIWGTMHGVTTNFARSQFEALTAVNDPHLNDDAFIKNLGGQMRLQTILTNPKLWQGKRSEGKVPENITDWQYSKNTRWIDNWGKLYSQDTRFGGECGGMCGVVNRATSGTVYIGGGNARFYNGVTTKSILYLEKTPRQAVLQNITTPAAKIEESWVVMNANGSDGRSTPGVIVRGVPAP